jgi:hypothetical protein
VKTLNLTWFIYVHHLQYIRASEMFPLFGKALDDFVDYVNYLQARLSSGHNSLTVKI